MASVKKVLSIWEAREILTKEAVEEAFAKLEKRDQEADVNEKERSDREQLEDITRSILG